MAIKYFKIYSMYNKDRIVIIKIKSINSWMSDFFEERISYFLNLILNPYKILKIFQKLENIYVYIWFLKN